jgi:uncharacterized protein YfaS (alpha-2-macroglobulin family)
MNSKINPFVKISYIILMAFFILSSCKKEANSSNTDNLYKYRKYVYYTTSGVVSKNEPIKVAFSQDVSSWEANQEITDDIFSISPSVKGKLQALNKRTLIFKPDEPLKSNTEYTVTVRLKKLFNIEKAFKKYTFAFKTIQQNFKVTTDNLQSYSKDWQYLKGRISTADDMSLETAKQLISATQKGKKLSLKWDNNLETSRTFEYTIDSIQRLKEDSKIAIKWHGSAVNIDNKGENTFTIIGQNNFSVVSVNVYQSPELHMRINFSDPLKKKQNFSGLVNVSNSGKLKYVVDGNILKVYPTNRIIGNVKLEVFRGIKSSDGYKLKKGYSENVAFEQLKPQVKLVSSGVILPNSSDLKFNFKAVNLKSVDVRVIKIYENNVLQFLQSNHLNSNNRYEIRRVGRRIAKKTIRLIKNDIDNDGKFKTYSVDLSKLIKAEQGAIYRVEISFKKAYSLYSCDDSEVVSNNENDYDDYYEDDYYYDDTQNYTVEEAKELNDREEQYWDNLIYNYRNNRYYNWRDRKNPCKEAYFNNDNQVVSQNILASNLGVIAKKGENKNYYFAVTDILSTNPVSGAKVVIYNYQQQEIATTSTDSEGFATFKADKNAYFAIISKNLNATYIKLDDGNSLSLSKFDVSGKKIKKGLLGYIYGERGVWRPGDTLHLNFILNDKANKLPKNHPVRMEVTDAKQKLVYKKVLTQGVDGFYQYNVATSDAAPTGNWLAKVSVGGAEFTKYLKVETIKPNRLKIKIDFDDEVLHAKNPINGQLDVKWLHGAPAKNLKTEVKVKFSNTSTSFKKFQKYVFSDPTRHFYGEEYTMFNGKLNDKGNASISKKVNFKNKAPGMLRATFFTRAFENGGDFSMDVFSKNYAPYISFVGLKSPKERSYGSFYTNEDVTFDVVTVDDNGTPIKRKGLEVKIYEIQWRWWWSSSYDDLSSYSGSKYHRTYKSFKIDTDSNGKASFKVNVKETDDYYGGRYLIRVYDPKSGHATGRTAYFYRDWWKRSSGGDKEAAKMLVFSADKDKYDVGETARITFPSGTEGRALISIENGNDVLSQRWIKTKKGETTVDIPITKVMSPNVFINISLLQPHAAVENDLPLRLYGIIPILVEDPNTKIQPIIDMPKTLEPEQNFTVKVKEKNGKPMTYTIAVVDEGLLDLTRFKTPNAWSEFYKRQALGVKTWDVFDDIIGAYSGSIDQIFAIGGDGSANGKKAKKANRFKPVVMTLGPFTLKANKSKSHVIKMPKYIGSVRTMVISGNNSASAYGNAEETTPVKKPLMVLASLPRKLSPGEKVTLPVTVFAMEKKIKNATISLKLSDGIKVIGSKTQQLQFENPDEKMVYFDLDVSGAKGIGKIEVIAKGHGEKSSYEVEIDVVNPNPVTNKSLDIVLEPNATQTIDFDTFGINGSNSADIEFSTLPAMNFTQRLAYLIRYPHGCVEQTTSSVFPQLYLGDIFDLTAQKKQKMQENIKVAVQKLGDFQTTNGGLSYWRGQNYSDDWGSTYAGHFMIEAEKKGFVLPLTFMSNWLKYQKQAAKDWRVSEKRWNNTLSQAYRLYTLALAGHADLSSMNRLREENLSNDAKWRLAAAYALAGQKEAAKKIANTANINFKPYKYDYYSYGSVDRNRAMAMETMLLVGDNQSREMAKYIAKRLSSNSWMSTQSTSYSLLAMAKMVDKNGGKSLNLNYNINAHKSVVVKTDYAVAQRKLNIKNGSNSMSITNNQSNVIFVRVLNSGILPLGDEIAETRGLQVSVVYKNAKGKVIDVSKLTQGTDFIASVTVQNQKYEFVHDVALTEVFPSGWEIVNTRFTDYGNVASSSADFTDIRDDRVNFYFDLKSRESKTFNVLLNASYLGKYYRYGIQAEAMYDNDYFTRTKGQWIEIVK